MLTSEFTLEKDVLSVISVEEDSQPIQIGTNICVITTKLISEQKNVLVVQTYLVNILFGKMTL